MRGVTKYWLSSLTYVAPIYDTVDYTTTMKGKKQESTEKDVILGRMPIMLRSCSCVLYGKDEEQLAKLEECPLDPEDILLSMARRSSSEKTKSKTIIKMEKEKDILLISAVIFLRDIFLANVPVHQHNFRKKCIYVPVMMRRMMEAILNKDAMDDKDYVGNKRLELSGQLLSLLFEDLFKTMNSESKRAFDASSSARDILYCIKKYNRITLELGRALSTGNWDVKRFGMHKKGVTDVVARLSYIGTLGNMTKIKPQFEKPRKVSGS
ncbi:DNA-directed RNA polymerase III subunit RPC2 [Capsicum baccatum]|uniref:DNA-directed RNA polymerase n=1 Tax=Capsicum baccatum TaxID=33114 RepID=A0A2G2WDU1_CAPBA|nr:DNA-directed RNA polymerase III subunit RPC2 [Capsicum baccatum]